jgi:hypothetical protein
MKPSPSGKRQQVPPHSPCFCDLRPYRFGGCNRNQATDGRLWFGNDVLKLKFLIYWKFKYSTTTEDGRRHGDCPIMQFEGIDTWVWHTLIFLFGRRLIASYWPMVHHFVTKGVVWSYALWINWGIEAITVIKHQDWLEVNNTWANKWIQTLCSRTLRRNCTKGAMPCITTGYWNETSAYRLW